MEKNTDLLVKNQHSILNSILLHLIPGIIILGGIFLFSQPFFCEVLGFDPRFAPVLGWLLSIFFCLILVQLGILLFAGKKQTKSFSFKGVVDYTEKSPTKQYLLYIPLYLLFAFILFMVVAPPINEFFVEKVFWWYPQEYNFQDLMLDPTAMKEYKGFNVIFVLYVILSCIAGPFVEEIYFRGYLLPRMEEKMGKSAPYINTILFSIYHFFSPWENLIRIVGLIPLVYLVWRKKNIRFGIFAHVILNCLGAVAMAVMVYVV